MSIEERLKEMIIKQLGDGNKPVVLETLLSMIWEQTHLI
jgi:hypothetical protein